MNPAGGRFRHAVDGMSLLSAHADFDNARIIFYKLSNGLSPKAPQPSKFADPIMLLERRADMHWHIETRGGCIGE
jgi:hypothetical protein